MSGNLTRDVVLVAHGSPDSRHARDIDALIRRVAGRAPHLRVTAAYLDHHGPSVADVGTAYSMGVGPIILVPVLLTRAFHTRVDIPDAAEGLGQASGRAVITAEALGPHPLVATAVRELLRHRQERQVVVFLAGSSRRAAIEELVEQLRAALGPERSYAFATLDGYLPLAGAVRDLGGPAGVVGVAGMIAQGVLRDRMVSQCAEHGVPFADGVLAQTDALAELTLLRIGAARSAA